MVIITYSYYANLKCVSRHNAQKPCIIHKLSGLYVNDTVNEPHTYKKDEIVISKKVKYEVFMKRRK